MKYSEKNWARKIELFSSAFFLGLILLLHIHPPQNSFASIRTEGKNAQGWQRFLTAANDSVVIYYDSSKSESIVSALLTVSPQIFPKLEKDFGITLKDKVRVVLFAESRQYQRMPQFRYEPEWAAGEALPEENVIVVIIDRLGFYPDLDSISVFTHELTHIFLFNAVQEGKVFIPRWFDEGVAMLEARKWGVRDHFELVSSLITGVYIPLDSLRGNFPQDKYNAAQAYVESFSFMTFLADRYGEQTIFRLISEMKEGKEFDHAFSTVFGDELRNVEKKWIGKITMWYRWVPVVTSSFTLWTVITLLFIIVYLRKKKRNLEIMKTWEEEDHWMNQ